MSIRAEGGCHCGAVRFSCQLDDEPVPALACNCSICSATGFMHLIVPHDRFILERGTDALTHYRFGTGAADPMFCKVCGVKSFYQPRSHPEAWSVNANCLDTSIELAVEAFDGRNWDEAKAALDGELPVVHRNSETVRPELVEGLHFEPLKASAVPRQARDERE